MEVILYFSIQLLNLKSVKRNIFYFIVFTSFFINTHQLFSQTDAVTQVSEKKGNKVSKKEKKAEKKRLDKEYMEGRRWRIASTFINASLDTYIQFEGAKGVLEAKLSLEDQLGFDKTKIIPKLDFQYSFNRHSSLYAEYYNIARSSSFDADEDFDWGDIEVPEGAGVDIFVNTQIWSFGYMYSFINKPDAELSFFANVFVLGLSTGLDIENRDIHDRFRITAPLPSIGYRFSYEILPKVRFGGTHTFFLLQIGDYGGAINNVKLNLDYRALKWLSAGASYSKFDLDINSKARAFKGEIKYAYQGPGLYLLFLF